MSETRKRGISIGYVPTMGALHQGHLELVKTSMAENDYTIVSIFVNPRQFNNKEDFEKYPVDEKGDVNLLADVGCDALFLPSYAEVYPAKTQAIKIDLGNLDKVLEGAERPGHFEGVVQVVYRFFELINPDVAYFGMKDFQQCMVVNTMKKAYFPKIKLKFCPIIRENSGLAMSSRNMRLSKEGRESAANIFKVINTVKNLSKHIEAPDAIKYGLYLLKNKGINVQYLSLANSDSLALSNKWLKSGKNVLLIAAFVEGVRLIDNIAF